MMYRIFFFAILACLFNPVVHLMADSSEGNSFEAPEQSYSASHETSSFEIEREKSEPTCENDQDRQVTQDQDNQ